MAISDVSVRFSADLGSFTGALAAAQASTRAATADMSAGAGAAGVEFAKLNATLAQLVEAAKRGADAASGLDSFKNVAVTVGALSAAVYGLKSASDSAASGMGAFVDATRQAFAGAVTAVANAAASWRDYAESAATLQRYLPLVRVENDGLAASIGRMSIAFSEWWRSAEIYKSGLLDIEGAAIAASGNMTKVAAAAKAAGFDNATRLLQSYTTQLTRVPGLSNAAAAAIEAGFAQIPNYSGALNQSLIDITVSLSSNAQQAEQLGQQLSRAMTDPATSGQKFLATLGGVNVALMEQFATAQRNQSVGQMQAVLVEALIAKERLLGAEKIRGLKEQLDTYAQLGRFGSFLSGAIRGQVDEAVKFQEALDKQLATLQAQATTIKTMAPNVEQLRSAMLGLVTAANPLSAQIETATGKIRVLSQGLRASTGDAAALVKQFEGFSSKAYLDSDGKYRVGYGSDTTTDAAGQVSAVTAGTTTTEEDAQRDLARRIVEFQQEAAQQIGAAWAGLSDKAKASITSVTYNYGHVPDGVKTAAQTGDDRDIAAAIRGLSANPDRRQQEANNITSPTLSGMSDPKLIAQANEALAQQKDALQQIEDTKAGGNIIDQATLSNLERTLSGKKDEIADAQAIVAAAQQQLDLANSAEAKAKAQQTLDQAKIGLQDKLNDAKKAELALDVARASTPEETRDAKVAAAEFEMSLYAEDTAAYKRALAEKEAADTAFEADRQKNDAAAEDAHYQNLLKGLDRDKQALQERLQNNEIGKAAMLAADLALEDQRTAIEKAHFEKLKAIWDEGTAEYRKAAQQLAEVDAGAAVRRETVAKDANAKILADYQSAFRSIGSTISASLMGILEGTTTFKGLLTSVAESIVQMFLKAGVDMVADWAAVQAKNLVATIASQTQQTAAVSAGVAARSAAETAGSATSIVSTMASVVKSIEASAAETFAGIFGFLAPVMGPAAAGPAAAGEATVAAVAGSVPSFAVGAWSLPSDMIAQVHAGEMIVPAGPAAALRGALSGGGASAAAGPSLVMNHATNINVSAVDGASVAAFFQNNAKPMLRAIDKAVRSGTHLGLSALNRA